MEALIGSHVVDGAGNKVAVSSFSGSGKYVGLYFSAHWCPPCRGFTPMLADLYNSVKSGPKGDQLEIVFVSSDRDAAAFNEYFKEMPWKGLPYENRDLKQTLSDKFGVKGIPTFIVLNAATGAVVHADGRGKVMGDPKGDEFPWA